MLVFSYLAEYRHSDLAVFRGRLPSSLKILNPNAKSPVLCLPNAAAFQDKLLDEGLGFRQAKERLLRG